MTLGSLSELGLKEVGNAADETDGEVGTLVGGDVETEEVDESVDDELTHLRNVKMVVDEGGERSQKAVGQWLAVDLIDNLWHHKSRFSLERRLDFFGQNSLIEIM